MKFKNKKLTCSNNKISQKCWIYYNNIRSIHRPFVIYTSFNLIITQFK